MRTQVGIIGAGPAGLLLGRLLELHGIDTVIVEDRSREYVEARQRAGVLEHGTVDLLRAAGMAGRLDRQGLEHGGIHLQFDGERHHIDFRALTGRHVTVYAQTEVVKDLIAARLESGPPIEFNVRDTAVADVTTDRPVLSYTDATGARQEVTCDVIAGCDGFHGISRPSLPAGLATVRERSYPYAWLGVIADVAPSSDELIYAHSPEGFALASMRSPRVSRLYLQVSPEEDLAAWPDERIWAHLHARLDLPGWTLHEGPLRDKGITPMRSFVSEPMRHGRLFLAGDAAHIVPPTGAKGLNLAMADVAILAEALIALLRDRRADLADGYSEACLRRVWRATYFSWWMTTMLHRWPGDDDFGAQLQVAQLRHVTSSTAAATALAENYTGADIPFTPPAGRSVPRQFGGPQHPATRTVQPG